MYRFTRLAVATALAASGAGLAGAVASPAAQPDRAQAAPSTCAMFFVASVRRGPHKGHDYAGALTLALDRAGRLRRGTFVPATGGRPVAVTGSVQGRSISLSVPTPDGTLHGTGKIHSTVERCIGTLRGSLKGPARRSSGDWLATTGQTIQLPSGAILFTGAETAGYSNPQVVYKAPPNSGASVFAGALNTPGNVDAQRLAARMNRPSGLAYDAPRNLVYVADVSNASIRRMDMGSNLVTTVLRASDVVAGARALGYTNVTGWEPHGVALAAGGGGALLISDVRNYVIWKYQPSTLQLKLFAGQPGLSGNNDGSDTAVRFTAPQQIMVSSDGLVGVGEPTTNRVRLRDPGNGRWSTIGVCC